MGQRMCNVSAQRSPLKDSAQLFSLESDHIDILPSRYQNFRLPAGKRVVSINHSVYRNSLGTVSHSYHLGNALYQGREIFTSQVPRRQHLNLSKNSNFRPALLTLFSTALFKFIFHRILWALSICRQNKLFFNYIFHHCICFNCTSIQLLDLVG